MAKTYTTTVNIHCLKEHTCVSCGAVHSYEFIRKIQGRGPTPDKSQKRAQANVDYTLKNVVDLHPCPACGLYQPDMVGQKRARWHKITFWIALVVFITLLILRGTDILQANVATWLIFTVGLLASLQLFGKELKNFNADPQSNIVLAADEIAAGKMQFVAGIPAEPPPDWLQMPKTAAQKLSLPLFAIGLLLLAGAELHRAASGWPLNPIAYPPVVGPGDTTRIYMNEKIHSLNGFWRGSTQVAMKFPNDSGEGANLSAKANENTWGSTIQVQSGEGNSTSTPWVQATFPNDPTLSGKSVACEILLNIEYPEKVSDSNFRTMRNSMRQTINLNLAAPNAGARYNQTWWSTASAGSLLILGTNLALIRAARALQKKATPTKILSLPAPTPVQAPLPAPGPAPA